MLKTKKKLVAELEEARAEADALSARLGEMQTTVEVQAEALERKDGEFVAFIARLQEAIGANLPDEDATLDAVRRLRAKADLMASIRDVMDGTFHPDAELLRRMACALGCAQFDPDALVQRAGVLAGVHSKNAALFREVVQLRAQLDEAGGER